MFTVPTITRYLFFAGHPAVVREDEVKNVHAYARGIVAKDMNVTTESVEVTYNPYKYDNFVSVDEKKPVKEADLLVLTPVGMFAHNAVYSSTE